MISKETPLDNYLEKAIKIVLAMFIVIVLLLLVFWGVDRYRAYRYQPVVNRMITLLEEKVRKSPRDLKTRILLAEAYMKNGQTDDAIEQLKQVLKVDSNYEDAIVDLGLAYMAKGELIKAEDQFKTEIAMNELSQYKFSNKRVETAYYYLAASQFKRHKYKDSEMNAKKALQIQEMNSDTLLLLGRVYLDTKKYKQAIVTFTKGMRYDPKFTDLYYGRALAYEKVNLIDKAVRDYKMALKLDPNFKDAKQALDRLK